MPPRHRPLRRSLLSGRTKTAALTAELLASGSVLERTVRKSDSDWAMAERLLGFTSNMPTRGDRATLPDIRPGKIEEEVVTQSDIRPIVPMHAVPWLVVTHEELRRLPLDSRAGFVVSLIDGRCTVEMLLDVAGLPEDEVIALLAQLARLGAIELRDA